MKTSWLLAACLAFQAAPAMADPDALKKIVIDHCVPRAEASGESKPCLNVDLPGRIVVLKDRNGATQLLLLPTENLTGIEDKGVLAPDAPNYFAAAWADRHLVEELAGKPIPRDDIGLSINSKYGRSQNLLHIHIDCLRADVRQALKDNDGKIGAKWAPLDVDLAGHRYHAMRLDGDDLAPRNPFRLLAEGDTEAAGDMGRETLTVAGAVFPDGKPGFYLLSDRADAGGMDRASSETLLDHDCAVLK